MQREVPRCEIEQNSVDAGDSSLVTLGTNEDVLMSVYCADDFFRNVVLSD